jgi:F0F1-type ATP synthase alpha subunit
MPPVSKIAQLPQELRDWLHQAFVARAFGDIEGITADLNDLMKQAGVAISIGKSAVGAESQRVKRAQEAIKATTEAAKLIANSARDDEDLRSEATLAIIQGEMFEALLQSREAESMDDPVARMAAMGKAATAMTRVTRARVYQAKHRIELEARTKAAADAVAKIAKKGGLSNEQIREIRSSILGIVKRDPPPAAEPGAAA